VNVWKRLEKIRAKKCRKIVGLMSGTSVDGVSLVLAEVCGYKLETKVKLLAYKTYPYPEDLRRMIFKLFGGDEATVENLCLANFVLGEFYAHKIIEFLREAGVEKGEVDLIASHGQTVYHIPQPRTVNGITTRATLQIGEPSVIAERTGITVVADFRPRDIAAGGQGAPIIAYVDYVLFRSQDKNVAVQNIGGIANVTYLPAGCSIEDVLAFDTGPGNMVIDGIVRRLTRGRLNYDVDGNIAARGRVSEELLKWLMSHPYISKKPPKTTGREMFGEAFVDKVMEKARALGVWGEDLVATVTAFTAESIAYNYEEFLGKVDLVILGGGGAKNKTLFRMLQRRLNAEIKTHEDFGIPEQAKEPLGMAVLANETIMGNPNNVPGATGARNRVIMGKIIP